MTGTSASNSRGHTQSLEQPIHNYEYNSFGQLEMNRLWLDSLDVTRRTIKFHNPFLQVELDTE